MSAEEGPTCRRVLLVRHGHYERTGGLGDEAWGLSPIGRRQATRVGRRLAQVVASVRGRFEGVYASPWPRAMQTAEIAAREMNLDRVKVKPYLHECLPLVDPDWLDLEQMHPDLRPPSPQDRALTRAQISRVRDRFFGQPRRTSAVVVFTHGNLIRYLVSATLRLPFEAWAKMDICHCSITELRVYAGGFEALITYNETGHFQPSMITTT